jgi:hypothetical protein
MIIILGLIVLIAAVVIGLAGAIATAGLSLLLAGARRTSRRGLRQSRQETAAVSRDRDDLADQRETARAYTAGTPGNGTPSAVPIQAQTRIQAQTTAAGAACTYSGTGSLPGRPPDPQNR